MLNYTLNIQGGFAPAAVAPTDALPPEQVLCHHPSAQGRNEGTGTVPSIMHTSILNFISMEKEFYRAKKITPI